MTFAFSAIPTFGGFSFARARIRLTYAWRHGRLPKLSAPTLFTELVQLRKLEERSAWLPALADKARVKEFVAARIGSEWVIPTLWHGSALPHRPEWATPFVVKSRHGCNQRAFVRADTQNWETIRRRAARWVSCRYGRWLDEWLYAEIPRGILVEPFVGRNGVLPIDWKFYVFGGRVCFIQVHLERETDHRWILMDRNWRRVSAPSHDHDPVPPRTLDKMIIAAERLARDLDFVRVDLYEVDGRPLFGEMTFYPGSGLDRFDPPSLDQQLGQKWLSARRAQLATLSSDYPVCGAALT